MAGDTQHVCWCYCIWFEKLEYAAAAAVFSLCPWRTFVKGVWGVLKMNESAPSKLEDLTNETCFGCQHKSVFQKRILGTRGTCPTQMKQQNYSGKSDPLFSCAFLESGFSDSNNHNLCDSLHAIFKVLNQVCECSSSMKNQHCRWEAHKSSGVLYVVHCMHFHMHAHFHEEYTVSQARHLW